MRHSKPVRLGYRTYRLVRTVSNCAYAVRLETAPTGGRKCLFIFRIHYKCRYLSYASACVQVKTGMKGLTGPIKIGRATRRADSLGERGFPEWE